MILDNKILQVDDNMYNMNYDFEPYSSYDMLNNRLFATFTPLEDLDILIESLTSRYNILYNKIFVLEISPINNEVIVTYNVEQGNINTILANTILVHRKKETNTLYSLNGLNELIKTLNGGVLDTSYRINWYDYKNCIILTQRGKLQFLKTKIHKIIKL